MRSGSRELPKPAAGEDSKSPVASRDDEPENDPDHKDDRGRDDGDRRRGDDDDRKDEEDVDVEVAAADVEHAVSWEAGAVRGCMWWGGVGGLKLLPWGSQKSFQVARSLQKFR